MIRDKLELPKKEPVIIMGGKTVVGTLGEDGKVKYDKEAIKSVITEQIAGTSGKVTGYFSTTAQVAYRYNTTRKTDTDNIWKLWKSNAVMDNRILQLNSLVFGRGLKWIYDDNTQAIIDRFWRINRFRRKLNDIGVDGQLYGEVFIGLFAQPSGDVTMTIYESRQVDIDFDPSDVYRVNRYIVTYKDDETGKEEQFDMMPIETYLNQIEFANSITAGIARKVRKALGLTGSSKISGKGVMCHIKFNNSSGEVNGTSDFYQIYDVLQDYLDFVGDRLSIHQMYGSPMYDITIDTDDPQVIADRIDELAGFGIGSNPVHNKDEKWETLEFKNGAISPTADDHLLRGILAAGMKFPEFMLFNQSEGSDDNTFSVTKIAQNRQDAYMEAFTDMHKFAVAIAGGDPASIDSGQIIFPEIDTMSEKAKAETYVLKVGANICSRRTAAMNMGHNYDIEQSQILDEMQTYGMLSDSPDFAGMIGGRFTSRQNNAASTNPGDDGTRDQARRADPTNVDSTQIVSSDKSRY